MEDAGRQPSFTGILLEEIAPQSARQPPPPLICTLRTDPKEQQHPHTHIHTQKKRSHKHKHTLPIRLLSFLPLSFPFFCFFWLTSAANETSRGAGAIWAAQPGCGGAFVGFSVCPGLHSLLRIQKMAPFLLGTSAAPKHISIPSPPPTQQPTRLFEALLFARLKGIHAAAAVLMLAPFSHHTDTSSA